VIKWKDDTQERKARRSAARDPRWKAVRRDHLRREPACAACGRRSPVTVHHIIPVTVDPCLEIDPDNLITLCRRSSHGKGCHMVIGHRCNWRSFEPRVREIAEELARIRR
jgi:5-methylcytosine-specific restriction endonuclease McrA